MARRKKDDKPYFVVTIGLDCTDLDIKILAMLDNYVIYNKNS